MIENDDDDTNSLMSDTSDISTMGAIFDPDDFPIGALMTIGSSSPNLKLQSLLFQPNRNGMNKNNLNGINMNMNNMNGINMNNSNINNGINNNNTNTNIVPNSILHSITNKLQEVSRNIFHLLFDCMMRDTVYQALVGAEEEEEEEYSSSSGNILRSVCTLGRTNFKNSLQTIHR